MRHGGVSTCLSARSAAQRDALARGTTRHARVDPMEPLPAVKHILLSRTTGGRVIVRFSLHAPPVKLLCNFSVQASTMGQFGRRPSVLKEPFQKLLQRNSELAAHRLSVSWAFGVLGLRAGAVSVSLKNVSSKNCSHRKLRIWQPPLVGVDDL